MMHLLDDAGVTTWADAALLAPAAFAAAEDAQRLMWDRGDAMLLELARLRIAQLIGATTAHALHSTRARGAGLTDEMVSDLRQWPTSPLFGERERLCLALTEQFVVDVKQRLSFLDLAQKLGLPWQVGGSYNCCPRACSTQRRRRISAVRNYTISC